MLEIWLEAKDELKLIFGLHDHNTKLQLHDHYVTIALHLIINIKQVSDF